ncbi:hypothetical protein [Novosphingobium sp. ST904]|uniref:hypothetical protein n=1 Tax=Novosphingobium sp. ST904 TaxID=1684385 RepID=UPI0006C8441E|nr:hypothetical protein [Novosphingobium sp. ST904]KPH66864.1 hypothetical protein ADT71_04010 [Novosphingobium sp. ST904]TCM40122.1 hypothetical protein EDF59_105362 [Novosphingobium sp. ST904]
MNMLERAARALANCQHGPDCWEGLDDDLQVQLIEEARAVIEAVREPSEEMSRAGEKLLSDERMHSISHIDMHDSWVVMVDALLHKNVAG